MKFYQSLPAILAGTAIVSALVVIQPPAAVALSGEEVNEIAFKVTVLIKGNGGHGSGVIVAKNGNTYYVLTNYHVVSDGQGSLLDDYVIVTSDDKKGHKPDDYNKVKRLPGVDLAVVSFTSKDKKYQVAKLANSDQAKVGMSVFVSGWPAGGRLEQDSGGSLTRQFTDGRISALLEQPGVDGYQMSYTNVTRSGMSGGPVLDAGGRVIAIHGWGDKETPESLRNQGASQENSENPSNQIKIGFNYAIPINTFLARQQAIEPNSLQVENLPAPQLGGPLVGVAPPQKRDKINNFSKIAEDVKNAATIGNAICGFLPFC